MKQLTALFFCFILIDSSYASSENDPDRASLDQFITTWNHNEQINYVAAFRDLDGDGKSEAIVYLRDRNWCGSGGCNTLILKHNADSWQVVSNIRISRPPIRMLDNVSHGWHSIGVWVVGGGIQNGYEAQLDFNGKSYPTNPSTVPVKRKSETAVGELVIPK